METPVTLPRDGSRAPGAANCPPESVSPLSLGGRVRLLHVGGAEGYLNSLDALGSSRHDARPETRDRTGSSEKGGADLYGGNDHIWEPHGLRRPSAAVGSLRRG